MISFCFYTSSISVATNESVTRNYLILTVKHIVKSRTVLRSIFDINIDICLEYTQKTLSTHFYLVNISYPGWNEGQFDCEQEYS